uniref:RFX-type winged-helix domain-containing protein n=1 Tax=Glossina brevipalpis TaxID=37001 RepID=A0A1A9WJD0_9MUSC
MTDKNGQGGQWKGTAAIAAQKQIQGVPSGYGPGVTLRSSQPASNVFYGSAGHHGSQSESSSYAAARFQAPPLSLHSAAPLNVIPPPVTSNVPVPSGFVPPPFTPAATAPTTVLASNPYAVTSLAGQNSASAASVHQQSTSQYLGPQSTHFGVEQLRHLNPQQQYELSKLMAVSFGNTQSNPVADSQLPSATTNISNVALSNSTAISRQSQPAADQTVAGVISSQLAEHVINTISCGNGATKLATTPSHGRLTNLGVHVPDDDKLKRIQYVVESGVGDHAKQQITQILDRISTLRPVEKLLLYLRLPGETPETDPLRQPQNPLGTRSEINHTINWVRTHLEQDPQVSIPKQDVYNDYIVYCERLDIKPLSTADFGKVMKQVFPGIRPRRLGTRGHSRYCYAAMRKTSKLPAPHLPTLNTTTTSASNDADNTRVDSTEDQDESWNIIKEWAENILNFKGKNLEDLANHIKGNALTSTAGSHTAHTGAIRAANVTHKKYTQREPKEKRLLVDMGPLKKRRKKKRKGSSSSESSCNQSVATDRDPHHQLPQDKLSPSFKNTQQTNLSPAMDDGQKSMKMIKIKQEVVDAPSYTPIMAHIPLRTLQDDNCAHPDDHSSLIQAQQQQQILPMNLASENRGGLVIAPLSSAFEHVRPSASSVGTAVKNLTPKIMELSSEDPIISLSPANITIKEEELVDDYNTANIFCKKVLKAQQTKGFYANSPKSSSSASLPIITTTASTPPPTSVSVIATPNNNLEQDVITVSNFSMGPPTLQMAPSISPSSHSLHDDTHNITQPKVLSRNLQQLRAKKFIMAATSTAANTTACDTPDLSAVKGADLPENLGLPRERVISICNMDKHELDDYFLPVEEENSEDQETELLQYFQMGDAEEKLDKNSSSDAMRNINNPTVTDSSSPMTATLSTSITIATAATTTTTTTVVNKLTTQIVNDVSMHPTSLISPVLTENGNKTINTSFMKTVAKNPNAIIESKTVVASSLLTPPAVGFASASLTQLSQKHHHHQQQQQQQHQQQQELPLQVVKHTIKRKINLNTSTPPDIAAARKNYSFLPISPNINSTPSNNTSANNPGFFASPSMSRLLTKQQSLDCDSSDPMIGSGRRRRSYFNVTSASAPPSPSVLKQQKEQQLFGMQNSFLADQWLGPGLPDNAHVIYNGNSLETGNSGAGMLSDQNSLDLDLFGEATATTVPTTVNNVACNNRNNVDSILNNSTAAMGDGADGFISLNEVTQRSQSVPLSQLQRSHSPSFNRSFHAGTAHASTVYSACASLVQTPVPTDFGDSTTMLSENSCSQQSATIKLEEVGGVVASDSTAILDDVDVSEILSSPDFVTKFSSIAQSGTAITTCSSAGSSSGYSSAGHFNSSLSSYSGGMSSTAASRSVPSTPLPHQNQQNAFSGGRRFGYTQAINKVSENRFGNATKGVRYSSGIVGSSLLSRSACDISKSMPSTPITTTPSSNFRYSPSEITRDFLINGNTIDDSITSSFNGVDNENLMGSDVVGVNAPLTSDSLLSVDNDLVNGSTKIVGCLNNASDFTASRTDANHLNTPGVGESSSIMLSSDLLDNL